MADTAPDSSIAAEKRRRFAFPGAHSIVFALILLAAALSWVVPSGQYTRVQDTRLGREVAVRGSYHATPPSPQTLVDVVRAPIDGFYDDKSGKTRAADVAIFVLFVGGFMGVLNRTGAIDVAMAGAIRGLAGREQWLIPILMALFALGGSTYGMEEEAIPLLALLAPLMLRAGYDTVVAAAIVIVGTTVGRYGSTINPFFTGVASNAAVIGFTDGLELRLAMLGAGWSVSTLWVMRYAARVRRDPARSLVADRRDAIAEQLQPGDLASASLSRRQATILGLFILTFALLIWGVSAAGWWMTEMSALFLASAMLIAVAGGIGEKGFIDAFIGGARDLLGVALIIGLARGVLVVMTNGQITDTILHGGELMLNGLPRAAFVNGILTTDFLMTFAVPSQSGLSALTTPVLAPLADFADVPRALVVTAVQSGSSVAHLFAPTSAATMGMLAVGHVPYQRWLRFILPLAAILFALAALSLSVTVMLG